MYPVVVLTAFYGFRRSEALGLKWSHIDFNAKSLTVQDTVVRCGKTAAMDKEKCTKNDASHRMLPLKAPMKKFLLKLQKKQAKQKKLLGSCYNDNDYVCKWENGEPFKPTYITDRFIKVLSRSSLPRIRFHDLRHSAASILLKMGHSIKEIQEWLGHSIYATTADIYGHLEDKAKKNMASSMGNKLDF